MYEFIHDEIEALSQTSRTILDHLAILDKATHALTDQAEECATLASASNIWAADEVQAEADNIRGHADDIRLFARTASMQLNPDQRELFFSLIADSATS